MFLGEEIHDCSIAFLHKHDKMGEQEFAEIEGGGSLILAWQIRNKRVLVVGGGEAS
jgi:hypothetical protein